MTTRNGDMPAMPCKVSINRDEGGLQEYQFGNNDFVVMGLTKREQFAMAAMQGMLAHATRYKPREGASENWHEAISEEVVQLADALLAELGKSGGE